MFWNSTIYFYFNYIHHHPPKILGNGVPRPNTMFCLICTINFELKHFLESIFWIPTIWCNYIHATHCNTLQHTALHCNTLHQFQQSSPITYIIICMQKCLTEIPQRNRYIHKLHPPNDFEIKHSSWLIYRIFWSSGIPDFLNN